MDEKIKFEFLFPKSIQAKNLFCGFIGVEILGIVISSLAVFYLLVFVNITFIALYVIIAIYSLLTFRYADDENNLFSDIKKRVIYSRNEKLIYDDKE